jgi:hypothetical protein
MSSTMPKMSNTMPDSSAASGSYQSGASTNGWLMFVAVILVIDGILDALWGLAAVLNNEVITVGGHGVIVWDVTAWGWAHLIAGSLMALTGLGMFSGRSWARWLGILFVSLNVLVQFGTFTLFPLWSMLIIALDIVVLYQLTARWEAGA